MVCSGRPMKVSSLRRRDSSATPRNDTIAHMKKYYVYIMNSSSGTIYTGMTNDLHRRVFEHKKKLIEGFTKNYNVNRLSYYEETNNVHVALAPG